MSSVESVVLASPGEVWGVLDDTALLARCLPGAELTEDLGDGWYRGRARVSLGPVRLAFAGVAHVVERDAAARTMRVLAQGEDRGGGRVQADIRLGAAPHEDGTRLAADAHVYLAGRIAQFGRSLADDVSRRMFEEFAAAVAAAATGGDAAGTDTSAAAASGTSAAGAGSGRPASVLRILGRSVFARVRALFSRRSRR